MANRARSGRQGDGYSILEFAEQLSDKSDGLSNFEKLNHIEAPLSAFVRLRMTAVGEAF